MDSSIGVEMLRIEREFRSYGSGDAMPRLGYELYLAGHDAEEAFLCVQELGTLCKTLQGKP